MEFDAKYVVCIEHVSMSISMSTDDSLAAFSVSKLYIQVASNSFRCLCRMP